MEAVYVDRVKSVVTTAMGFYKEAPVPNNGVSVLIERAGSHTIEYKLKGKAWKDFSNDVKKLLNAEIAAFKLEKKNEGNVNAT